jgi:hypothetical protein
MWTAMSPSALHVSKPIAPYAAGTYARGRTTAAQNAAARTPAIALFRQAVDRLDPIRIGDRVDEGDVWLDMGNTVFARRMERR